MAQNNKELPIVQRIRGLGALEILSNFYFLRAFPGECYSANPAEKNCIYKMQQNLSFFPNYVVQIKF